MRTLETDLPRNSVQAYPIDASRVARKAVAVPGRALALVVALVLALPVVLLPFTSSVPALIWVGLLPRLHSRMPRETLCRAA
jgi:hypothetical protein